MVINMDKYMKIAFDEAYDNQDGGPFGAIILKNNEVIAISHNKVLKNNDPTAHAEIEAIRMACSKLGTYDLTGCVLYTTCEPCPMCLSAIIWANIKEVYFGCTRKDAESIGFKDNMIYEYLKGNNPNLINFKKINRDECLELFEKYDNVIY